MSGLAYAGDCSTTTPANIGADCSKYVSSNARVQAYAVGLTFSEFTEWLFVEQTQSGWVPIGSVALDDSAGPATVPWPAG
jgi:hypothetical protein